MKKAFLSIVLALLMGSFAFAQPAVDGGIKNWGVFEDSIVTDAGQTVDDTSATITLGYYNKFMLWSYAKNVDGTADSVRINYHMEVSWDAVNFTYFDSSITVRKTDTASYARFTIPDSLKYYPYMRYIAQMDSTDGTDSLYVLTKFLMMEDGQ